MANIVEDIRKMRATPTSLATGLSAAVIQGDARLAVQLAWRLIFQPDCPLLLQTHAILVHSALSLRLGARPELIEGNLRATIHRLAGGTELKRLALRGHLAPWKLEVLAQLHSALRSLRVYGEIPLYVRRVAARTPTRKRFPLPERVVEGMEKLEVGRKPENSGAEPSGEELEQQMEE